MIRLFEPVPVTDAVETTDVGGTTAPPATAPPATAPPAQVEAGGVPLAVYVAPGTEHTIIGGDEVYEMEVEGVRLIDWITELVGGGIPADVHCVECAG